MGMEDPIATELNQVLLYKKYLSYRRNQHKLYQMMIAENWTQVDLTGGLVSRYQSKTSYT